MLHYKANGTVQRELSTSFKAEILSSVIHMGPIQSHVSVKVEDEV